ncbi:MAG: UDP-N-acetylglucosamine 2-epimerase (non-hydrolyzing) [Campylobacteraceae bacterium]|jgi:UDP-N-acetylglucosamine 2-epimerase (non-hydrolysing)|nr:UDP-N-acetylglucosamine 2-epimerase (non-hydrolyzing) [Campylobacteraceae bacterium]
MKKILFILGTRPEVIKLAPLVLVFKQYNNIYKVTICNTEQQKELSNQTLNFFELKADITLNIMTKNQELITLQERLLSKMRNVILSGKFDAVIVQGDTMTAFCGALAGFYNKIPVFHVEAGLRSYNMHEPFPEEALRQMISRIAFIHFAPTNQSKQALLQEGIDENKIIISGNTVIDALFYLSDTALTKSLVYLKKYNINIDDKLVLITVHRRENHGDRLKNIIEAIKKLAYKFQNHKFVIPVHPNPNVKYLIQTALNSFENIILLPTLDYPILVTIMKHAKLILTDSGGIQEEAPTFGVPILVMRYETERKEGVEAGFAKLIGTECETIVAQSALILEKNKTTTNKNIKNPYGDGNASKIIEQTIRKKLYEE